MPATAQPTDATPAAPSFTFANAEEVLSRLTAEGAMRLTGWLQGALMQDSAKSLEQAVMEFARYPRSPELMAALFYPRNWFHTRG